MANYSWEFFSPIVSLSFIFVQFVQMTSQTGPENVGPVSFFSKLAVFGCISYTYNSIARKLQAQRLKIFRVFSGIPRHFSVKIIEYAKGIITFYFSVYTETAFIVLLPYVRLLQVNWSYIWLGVFPVTTIAFIYALYNELNRDEREAGACGGSALGGGKEIKKAEGMETDGLSGGDLGSGGKGMNKGVETWTLVVYWVLCSMEQLHIANNFAVSMFLFFLSFTLGALTRMMMKLALTRAAPGGAPASALLRKASLVVLLVAVHAAAVELLGEQVVLFVLPELAPLLLWLSVHVDRAKEGAIVTADQITFSRKLVSAVAVVVLACIAAATMDDESIFSWVAKAVVSCGVSALLVCYLVFMISQWQGQDAEATPFLDETVKLLKVWAKVLLITAGVLLVPTSVAAERLGLHEQMLAAPAQFFNNVSPGLVHGPHICDCIRCFAMDESIFSWVSKAVVSCGVSGLLVCYLVFMMSQWQEQDAEATPFLKETVKLLEVWAKVLLITAAALLVPTSVAAARLGLHEQMLAAPAEFFN